MEEKLGFSDERTLLVIGRSVASLRDPARLPDADARFERIHTFLRDHGSDPCELAGTVSSTNAEDGVDTVVGHGCS